MNLPVKIRIHLVEFVLIHLPSTERSSLHLTVSFLFHRLSSQTLLPLYKMAVGQINIMFTNSLQVYKFNKNSPPMQIYNTWNITKWTLNIYKTAVITINK